MVGLVVKAIVVLHNLLTQPGESVVIQVELVEIDAKGLGAFA